MGFISLRGLAFGLGCLGFVGCTAGAPAPSASSSSLESPPQSRSAAPPSETTVAPTASAPEQKAPAESATASAPSAVLSASSAAPSSSAVAAPSLVTVKNIGMHIGGESNDAVTKGPIKRSVEPHMEAFAACFSKADSLEKGGDISVDLRIEKDGGKATLKKYKSAIAGADFEACVRGVFEAIDFEKPKTGTTVVSYSLRFQLKKG